MTIPWGPTRKNITECFRRRLRRRTLKTTLGESWFLYTHANAFEFISQRDCFENNGSVSTPCCLLSRVLSEWFYKWRCYTFEQPAPPTTQLYSMIRVQTLQYVEPNHRERCWSTTLAAFQEAFYFLKQKLYRVVAINLKWSVSEIFNLWSNLRAFLDLSSSFTGVCLWTL